VTSPTIADRRAALQKSLGYTDDQMAAHEEMIIRSQAPIIENTGWSRLEKKTDLDTYRKEIEAELKLYPQERRTPELMEKVYYYVRGKHAEAKPEVKGKPQGRVTETKVSGGPGYTGQEGGVSGEGRETSEEEALSEGEKFVVAKLNEGGMMITEKEYAASRKAGKSIRALKVPDTRPATSLADIELKRMTRR